MGFSYNFELQYITTLYCVIKCLVFASSPLTVKLDPLKQNKSLSPLGTIYKIKMIMGFLI